MTRTSVLLAILILPLVALSFACSREDPVVRIERQRAHYEADLSGGGFVVKDVPGDEHPDILVDVLLRNDGQGSLSTITLDFTMENGAGVEKAHRRVTVDCAGVGPGGSQISVTLKGLPYESGDRFWVEVRSTVPASDRGEYPEFAATGGRG